MDVEEFVNPKSMITPGVAAALVATAAGACFAMLGIVLPVSLVVLSFFVGGVVFHSKEFGDPSMTVGAKAFFYVLNSIIIFSMATGTHAVLDRQQTGASSGIRFVGVVWAQEVPTVEQQRPFFHDWTRNDQAATAAGSDDPTPVEISVADTSTGVRSVLVNLGVATPIYNVQLQVDDAAWPQEVRSVTWQLPEGDFGEGQVMTSDASTGFRMNVQAWRPFQVGAEIELESGEIMQFQEMVTLAAVP